MVIANRIFLVFPSSFIYPHVLPPGVPVVVVSWASFIFPVSRCLGRHLCTGANFSLCPGRHLYPLFPGRHLCPAVPVCSFSLSVLDIIYIPCVPVVICVPVSWSVTSSYNDVICKPSLKKKKHTKKRTCLQLIFIYIDDTCKIAQDDKQICKKKRIKNVLF